MKKIIIFAFLLAFSFVNMSFTSSFNLESKKNNISLNLKKPLGDKIKVKIKNASGKNRALYYQQKKGSGGKATITLSSHQTATIEIAVGGAVYTKEGTLLLTITANMANTTQTVIK